MTLYKRFLEYSSLVGDYLVQSQAFQDLCARCTGTAPVGQQLRASRAQGSNTVGCRVPAVGGALSHECGSSA